MTDQPTIEPAPVTLTAAPGSRLAALQAAYAEAKAQADAATAALKAITDGIKTELYSAAPEGERKIELARTEHGPALRLTYSESWRVDAKKLKAEQPALYVRYAKKSGSWSLKAAGGEG